MFCSPKLRYMYTLRIIVLLVLLLFVVFLSLLCYLFILCFTVFLSIKFVLNIDLVTYIVYSHLERSEKLSCTVCLFTMYLGWRSWSLLPDIFEGPNMPEKMYTFNFILVFYIQQRKGKKIHAITSFLFQLNIFNFMEIQHNSKSFAGTLLYMLYSFLHFFVLQNMVTCTTIS